jgi:hypothetical protein
MLRTPATIASGRALVIIGGLCLFSGSAGRRCAIRIHAVLKRKPNYRACSIPTSRRRANQEERARYPFRDHPALRAARQGRGCSRIVTRPRQS